MDGKRSWEVLGWGGPGGPGLLERDQSRTEGCFKETDGGGAVQGRLAQRGCPPWGEQRADCGARESLGEWGSLSHRHSEMLSGQGRSPPPHLPWKRDAGLRLGAWDGTDLLSAQRTVQASTV